MPGATQAVEIIDTVRELGKRYSNWGRWDDDASATRAGWSGSLIRSTSPPMPETITDPDGPLRAELRVFARARARWGHRCALVSVREAAFAVNHKKIQRLWREEALRVKVPVRRKRAGRSEPSRVWCGQCH